MAQEFRFQSVLNHRRQKVEEGQLQLARLQQLVVQLQDQQKDIDARRSNFYRLIKERMNGDLNPAEVERHYRYLTQLNGQLAQNAKEIAAAEKAVDQARMLLADALKERKTLEKLKEYEEAKHLQEMSRKEQETTDDLNISRHSRKH